MSYKVEIIEKKVRTDFSDISKAFSEVWYEELI